LGERKIKAQWKGISKEKLTDKEKYPEKERKRDGNGVALKVC